MGGEMRKCKKCGEEKPLVAFNESIGRSNRLYYRRICRTCENKYKRSMRQYYNLQNNYGINEAQYELMLKSQSDVCAICGQPETIKRHGKIQFLSVDHNHKTSKIRGLLCHKCNVRLAVFEDEDFKQKAIAYLEKNK